MEHESVPHTELVQISRRLGEAPPYEHRARSCPKCLHPLQLILRSDLSDAIKIRLTGRHLAGKIIAAGDAQAPEKR